MSKIIAIILGAIGGLAIFFGLFIIGYGLFVPAFVATAFFLLGFMFIVGGVGLIWLGRRISKPKAKEIAATNTTTTANTIPLERYYEQQPTPQQSQITKVKMHTSTKIVLIIGAFFAFLGIFTLGGGLIIGLPFLIGGMLHYRQTKKRDLELILEKQRKAQHQNQSQSGPVSNEREHEGGPFS